MEVVDYCRCVQTELTAWKAKLFDAGTRMEQLPPYSRRRLQPKLGELRIIVALIEDKISMLKAGRPKEWAWFKEDIEEKFSSLRESFGELMDVQQN